MEVKAKHTQSSGQIPELLCLPASEKQIERMLLRAGIKELDGIDEIEMSLEYDVLPTQITDVLDIRCEGPGTLNALCHAIADLGMAEHEKLGAAVLMAGPSDASEVRELAENLNQFDFVPGVQTLEELMREDPAEQYQREMGGQTMT